MEENVVKNELEEVENADEEIAEVSETGNRFQHVATKAIYVLTVCIGGYLIAKVVKKGVKFCRNKMKELKEKKSKANDFVDVEIVEEETE